MADAKESKAPEAGAPAAGNGKLLMGLLGLNMVVVIAVAVVLLLGQKKQAQQQTLDQVAQGAAEAGGGHGEPAAAGGHGAPAAGGHGAPAAGEAAAAVDARFFALGDFVANLSGPASTSYVKVSVNFEISKDADEEELKQRKPQFRDKVISLLNAKKASDLQNADGRNYLKEEIKTVANTFVKKGKVEGVYFSAFVINN